MNKISPLKYRNRRKKKKKKAKKILIKSNEEDILGKCNNNKSKIYNINI